MDHDCTLNDRFGKPSCMTEFEQEIREDERERAVQRVEAIADDHDSGVDWNWDYDIDPTGMTRNPRVWIREAAAAIKKGEQ
jgi:hypothetical protein